MHLFTSGYPGHREGDPNTHRFFAVMTPFARGYPLSIPPFYPMLPVFRRHHFDLVHTHTPFTVGFVGLRWAESHGLPIVSTYHTLYDKYTHYIPLLPKRYVRYKIAKHTNFYYNHVDHVITPGVASSDWLRQHRVRTPVTEIPTGIPQARRIDQDEARRALRALPGQRVALYVGRLAEEKNLGVLMEAMRRALRADPSLVFWVVGDGPVREKYRRVAGGMGIGDRVRFFGFVPRDEVDAFYAAADVFVFASMTETQGLVVTEAMSYGLPAVVVNAGGAAGAVVDGVNGVLVRNSPDELCGAVGRVLGDEGLYSRLSDGAVVSGREASVPRMVDRVMAIYEEVLAARSVGEAALV